jgi:probable sporulation protein (polysaccharide deacetylase family)
LAEENVRATFFLDGSWLQKNAEMARQIAEQGHEMANHAYSHKNMSRLSAGEAREEISKTQTLIKEILGADNILFAPPSGDFSKETVRIARDLNLYTILWTLDTLDWKNPHPDWIVRKITSRLEPGALILMHPTESSSKALPAMIKEAKRRGYVIGTVSDLLSPYRVPYVETEFIF